MIVFIVTTELYTCVVKLFGFVIGNECIYVVNEREKRKEITPWDYLM